VFITVRLQRSHLLLVLFFGQRFGGVQPSREIAGVQETVGHFTAWVAEKVTVKPGYGRISMCFAVLHLPVQLVEPVAAVRTVGDLLIPVIGFDIDRLPPSSYAAGGTGHYLDKMIFLLPLFNRFDQAAGLPGTAGYRRFQAQLPHLDLGVFVFVRANLRKFDIF